MQEENVTITLKEYESLNDSLRWLDCLELAGVDNWDGYEEALDRYNETEE